MAINLFLVGKPDFDETGRGKKFSEIYKDDFVLPDNYEELYYYPMPEDYFYYFILSSHQLTDIEEGFVVDTFSAIGDVDYQEDMMNERENLEISNIKSEEDLITGFTMGNKDVVVNYMGSGWKSLD
jgi:hypothetical protein